MSQIIIKMPEGQKGLTIHSVPECAWVTEVERMVRAKKFTLIVGKDGQLYSPQCRQGYSSFANWWEEEGMLICLYRLKLVPPGTLTKAKQKRIEEEKIGKRKRVEWELRAACRKLGVKITRAMERQIKSKGMTEN